MSRRNRRSKVSHPGIGSEKARESGPVKDLDLSKIKGAQEKLNQIQNEEQSGQEEEDSTPAPELQDLRDLIFLGRSKEMIEVGNFKFEIETLNNDEKVALLEDLSLAGKDVAFYIRPYTLSRTVVSVNNVALESMYSMYGGQEEDLDVIDKRLFVINKWQASLVETLFKKYEELVDRSYSFFNPESLEDKEKLKK